MATPRADHAPIPRRCLTDRRLAGSHYRMLGAIAKQIASTRDGATCCVVQGELAAAASVHPTTAPGLIADLVEWGYLIVRQSDTDKRRLSYSVIYGHPTNDPAQSKRGRSRMRHPAEITGTAAIDPARLDEPIIGENSNDSGPRDPEYEPF